MDAGVADPTRTLFTFDCNPGGSDQGYAANQHICRTYARESGVILRDVDQGIVLAGGGATDDPEGEAVLNEVYAAANGDPDIKILMLSFGNVLFGRKRIPVVKSRG